MRIRLLPEAERDLDLGANFYEAQSAELGTDFIDSPTSDSNSLALFDGIHEKYRGFHRSMSQRFPFIIYYQVAAEVLRAAYRRHFHPGVSCRPGAVAPSGILLPPRLRPTAHGG